MGWTLTSAADRDMVAIYRYTLDTYGSEQADAYQSIIERAIERLVDFPHMGRFRLTLGREVRVYPAGQHIVVYEADPSGILVLRVRHQREDWEAHPERA